MSASFKQCPNCGNLSFYWEDEADTSQAAAGMVFLRITGETIVVANKPPHDALDEAVS